MRKYIVVGVELTIIAFVIGTMLSAPPLWRKGEAVQVANSAFALPQDR